MANVESIPITDLDTLFKISFDLHDTIIVSTKEEFNGKTLCGLVLELKPSADYSYRCSLCGRICQHYDKLGASRKTREFLSLPFGQIPVLFIAQEEMVLCPEHGEVTAELPWAYKDACSTKQFDQQVTQLCQHEKISTVAEYMDISFEYAKECIKRVLDAANPDASGRSEHLKSIIYRPEFWKKKFKEDPEKY